MRKETKSKKSLDKLAQWLQEAGHEQDKIKELVETVPSSRDTSYLQVEAVLLYLEKPSRFMMKQCKTCGEYFGTNYRGVAYCSNAHRAKTLFEQTGIRWNPHKSETERWGGEAPLIIPPAAVRKLRQFAEAVLAATPEIPAEPEDADEVIHQPTPDSQTNVPTFQSQSSATELPDLDFLFLSE